MCTAPPDATSAIGVVASEGMHRLWQPPRRCRPPIPWYRDRHARAVARAAGRQVRLDARRHGLHALRHGGRPAAHATSASTTTTAGMLGTVTLVMSGVGGTIFGYVADRFGRTRALMGTILIFSLASLGAATSQTRDAAAALARAARHRHGRRMGVGRRAGQRDVAGAPPQQGRSASCSRAGRSATCWRRSLRRSSSAAPSLGADAWRWLFVVGVVPAFFTLWIRRYVQEPETWTRNRASTAARDAIRSRVIFGPALHRAHAAHHRARIARCSSPTGASSSGCPAFLARPVDARRRRHGRRRLAAVDHPGADRRLPRLPHVRLHRRPDRTAAGVRAVS